VLKKISLVFVFFALCACASNKVYLNSGQNEFYTETDEINLTEQKSFRVGVLLPLSGNFAKQGQGLQNATMMALEDINDENLILQYYDTKGTPEGASVAATNAINHGVNLIIGPMLSSSVQAISPITTDKNIPVIAFNSVGDVLQNGVYTLGLLLDEQVDRIISYTANKGRKRFALLLPDNSTGIAVAKSAVKSAQKNNVLIVSIAFYKSGTVDFSKLLEKMTHYPERVAKLEKIKAEYEPLAKAGNPNAIKKMKQLEKIDTVGEVDFDTVLISDYGATLKSAVSMFGYYDVFSPDVKFIGTSIWGNTNLSKETTMRGSWYPSLSLQNSAYFVKRYSDLYTERPSSLYSLGYDAVALASAISRNGNDNLDEKITNKDGYIGINGVFRLFSNGYNQHSLDIREVRDSGNYIVDAAPRKFNNEEINVIEDSDFSYYKPEIFGKNPNTAELMIFGRILPENSSTEIKDYSDTLILNSITY